MTAKTSLFLRQNILETATLAASSEEDEFPVENVSDWMPGDYWKATASGTEYITADYGGAVAVDYAAIFGHSLESGDTCKIYRSSNGTSWTQVGTTHTHDGSGKVIFVKFASATYRYWKVEFVTASIIPSCAIVSLGVATSLPTGLRPGFMHPSFGADSEMLNNESRGGLFIGRAIKPKPQSSEIELTHLSESWIRTTWPALRDHLLMKPIFVVPNESDSTEVYLAWLDKNARPQPRYMNVTGLLSINLDMSAILK